MNRENKRDIGKIRIKKEEKKIGKKKKKKKNLDFFFFFFNREEKKNRETDLNRVFIRPEINKNAWV